ncbi:MAG: alpha/beta hydrolase, partial [Bacteroidota bacterium]
GRRVVAPDPQALTSPPDVEEVAITSASGTALAGWLVRAKTPEPLATIVLLHGIRGDRRGVLGRGRLLAEAGYDALLVDLQAHGESEGEAITFGHRERHDAIGAVRHARARLPGKPVGLLGRSLGGAAAVLAGADLGADAVVLEGVYADIASATENRLRMRVGPLAALGTPLLLPQLKWRLGISPDDLRPVDRIAELGARILIVAGTDDRHTTAADTRRLAAAAEPSTTELLWIEGAAHENLFAYDRATYRSRVLGFFHHHLRTDSTDA